MSKSLVNQWISRLSFWHTAQQGNALAGELARQCRKTLANKVSVASVGMSCDQMRGYIRAYATACIESSVIGQTYSSALTSTQISKAKLQAKELLIEMVVRDTQSVAPTSATTNFAAAA